MRIAQIVLQDATQFERKLQRVDFATLSLKHEVIVMDAGGVSRLGADVAHVYAGGALPRRPFMDFRVPYVASAPLSTRRFALRKPSAPAGVVSPVEAAGMTVVPEAVEEIWFEQPPVNELREERAVRRLGSFGGRRSGIQNVVEQTMARIHRFREDIEWRVFDEPPRPEDLAGVDVWIDPTTAISDFDGFVAEATVGGKPVIASRTPVNSIRLEQGRTGWLVPPADPNELTHAILGALFKPEVARLKMNAAAQTAGKFRPRQRLRVLERIYQTLIP